MKRTISINSFVCFLSVCIFIVLSIRESSVINLFHPEMDFYIPNFLSEKSLIQIIFSPINEFDLTNTQFRARELGSLFNYLDIILMLSIINFTGFFFSPVSILMGAFLIFILHSLFIKYYPDRLALITASIFCLFLSGPYVFMGILYRVNKVSCVLFFVISIWVIFNKENFNKATSLLVLTASSLASCMCDEQGLVLMVGLGIFLLLLTFLSARLQIQYVDILPIFVGIVLYFLYKYLLGPEIFYMVNGVSPSAPAVMNYLQYDSGLISESWALLKRYIYFVYPSLICFFLLTFLILRACMQFFRGESAKGNFLYILILGSMALMFLAVICIMGKAHRGIFLKDIVSYYSLPISVSMYFMLTMVLLNLTKEVAQYRKHVFVLLVMCVFYNGYRIIGYEKIIAEGHLKNFLKSDIVAKAVRLKNQDAANLLRSINVIEASPGYNAIYPYAEPSVKAIKKYWGDND